MTWKTLFEAAPKPCVPCLCPRTLQPLAAGLDLDASPFAWLVSEVVGGKKHTESDRRAAAPELKRSSVTVLSPPHVGPLATAFLTWHQAPTEAPRSPRQQRWMRLWLFKLPRLFHRRRCAAGLPPRDDAQQGTAPVNNVKQNVETLLSHRAVVSRRKHRVSACERTRRCPSPSSLPEATMPSWHWTVRSPHRHHQTRRSVHASQTPSFSS